MEIICIWVKKKDQRNPAMNGNLSYVASHGFVVLKSLIRRKDKAEG